MMAWIQMENIFINVHKGVPMWPPPRSVQTCSLGPPITWAIPSSYRTFPDLALPIQHTGIPGHVQTCLLCILYCRQANNAFLLVLAFFQFIFVFAIIDYGPPEYGSYLYPQWVQLLGWLTSASILAWIPDVAIYEVCRQEGGINRCDIPRSWTSSLACYGFLRFTFDAAPAESWRTERIEIYLKIFSLLISQNNYQLFRVGNTDKDFWNILKKIDSWRHWFYYLYF